MLWTFQIPKYSLIFYFPKIIFNGVSDGVDKAILLFIVDCRNFSNLPKLMHYFKVFLWSHMTMTLTYHLLKGRVTLDESEGDILEF